MHHTDQQTILMWMARYLLFGSYYICLDLTHGLWRLRRAPVEFSTWLSWHGSPPYGSGSWFYVYTYTFSSSLWTILSLRSNDPNMKYIWNFGWHTYTPTNNRLRYKISPYLSQIVIQEFTHLYCRKAGHWTANQAAQFQILQYWLSIHLFVLPPACRFQTCRTSETKIESM